MYLFGLQCSLHICSVCVCVCVCTCMCVCVCVVFLLSFYANCQRTNSPTKKKTPNECTQTHSSQPQERTNTPSNLMHSHMLFLFYRTNTPPAYTYAFAFKRTNTPCTHLCSFLFSYPCSPLSLFISLSPPPSPQHAPSPDCAGLRTRIISEALMVQAQILKSTQCGDFPSKYPRVSKRVNAPG